MLHEDPHPRGYDTRRHGVGACICTEMSEIPRMRVQVCVHVQIHQMFCHLPAQGVHRRGTAHVPGGAQCKNHV
jgi:hypothetical protein